MDRHKTKDNINQLQQQTQQRQQSQRGLHEVLDAYETHTGEWSAERKCLYAELERYEQIHSRLQQDYAEVELWLELYTTELLNYQGASQDKQHQKTWETLEQTCRDFKKQKRHWNQQRDEHKTEMGQLAHDCQTAQEELGKARSKWQQTYEQLTTLQVKDRTILERKIEENQRLKDSWERVKQELVQRTQTWGVEQARLNENVQAEMTRRQKTEAVLETIRQDSATQQQNWSEKYRRISAELRKETLARQREEEQKQKFYRELQQRKKLQAELEYSQAETQKLKTALDEVHLNFEEQSQNWQDEHEQLTHEHQQMKIQLQEAYHKSQQREKKVAGKSVTLDPMIFHLNDILVKGDKNI